MSALDGAIISEFRHASVPGDEKAPIIALIEMATSTGQPPAHPVPIGVHLRNFWRRVTEGLEVSQLWSQFESEARASYRLYSHDVAAKTPEGLTRRGHHLHVIKEFFWAVFEKLSPARRVLLLVALVLLVIPHAAFQYTGEAE